MGKGGGTASGARQSRGQATDILINQPSSASTVTIVKAVGLLLMRWRT